MWFSARVNAFNMLWQSRSRNNSEVFLFLSKVEFTSSNLKRQQLCKKPNIRMLFSYQTLSYSALSLQTLCTEDLNNFIQVTPASKWHMKHCGFKRVPCQRTWITELDFQHSTSQSVNPTHLKLVLCHDTPLQAFLLQFTSELFLYIHQYERR